MSEVPFGFGGGLLPVWYSPLGAGLLNSSDLRALNATWSLRSRSFVTAAWGLHRNEGASIIRMGSWGKICFNITGNRQNSIGTKFQDLDFTAGLPLQELESGIAPIRP